MSITEKKWGVILLSLLAILLLAGGCIWWAVQRHHKESPSDDLASTDDVVLTDYRSARDEPVESDVLFPTPDSVIYRKDSAHELCAEDEAKLIAVFEKVLATYQMADICRCLYDEGTLKEETQKTGVLEFRYATQLNCTAEPLRTRNEAPETDSVWVFLNENGSIRFVRVFDGKVQGNGHSYFLEGVPDDVREEYLATVRETLSHYDFEKPDWATAEIK